MASARNLLAFCRTLGGARTGEVKWTPAFRLEAKGIAHAVGPVWRGGQPGEDAALARCYQGALVLAVQHGATSIAPPAISTGVYGFPFERATHIALTEVRAAPEALERLILCFFSERDLALARSL